MQNYFRYPFEFENFLVFQQAKHFSSSMFSVLLLLPKDKQLLHLLLMQVIRKQYQNLSVHNVCHNCAISFSIIKALSQPKRLLISFFVQTFSIQKFFQLCSNSTNDASQKMLQMIRDECIILRFLTVILMLIVCVMCTLAMARNYYKTKLILVQ